MAATIRTDKIGPADGSADFTLPTADGSAKSALITDGSKVLSFATGTPSASNFLRGDGTWAAAGGGKVLQVVQGTVLDDTQSTTSASFVDMSPSLTATITPAATASKILINFVVTTGANEGWHAYYRILRGATPIGVGVANGSRKQATMEVSTGAIAIADPGTMNYLDSPSTTSATVYKIQWATESAGTIYLNRSHTWTDNSNFMTGISTITLMEIGA